MLNVSKSKIEENKVKQEALELYNLENRFKEIKSKYDVKKTKLTTSIKNFMYCMGGYERGFSFSFRPNDGATTEEQARTLEVRKVIPTKIIWDVDKLEHRLDGTTCKKIIEKSYTIDSDNFKELARHLKGYGVPYKLFMEYVTVNKKVNIELMEQLESIGDIKKEDVEDCYDVVKSNSYLRLNILEGKK